MTTTFDLRLRAERLILDLQEAGGELAPEAEAAWLVWLAETGGKMEALHAVATVATERAEGLRVEAARLSARAKALDSTETRCKALAMELLTVHQDLTGESKLKLATVTAWIQPSIRVVGPDDPKAWPNEYQRQVVTITPDKESAKKAIQNGAQIEGVKLEPGSSLRWM